MSQSTFSRTFNGEICTARKEGENYEDYKARRHAFNRAMYGFYTIIKLPQANGKTKPTRVKIKGYVDGQIHENA